MVLESIIRYYESLFRHIPIHVFQIEIAVITIIVSIIAYRKGLYAGKKEIFLTLLVGFVFLIFCYTVVFRVEGKATGLALMPFWSYYSYFGGTDDTLMGENLVNIIVFIPVGLLLSLAYHNISSKKILAIGCLLSISIEISQFVFKRGLCEVDDVIHNSLGCYIGYMLVLYSMCMVRKSKEIYNEILEVNKIDNR